MQNESAQPRTVESVSEARGLLERLEHGETMLESEVQGDGFLAGGKDLIRRYPHNDEKLQVELPYLGRVLWVETEKLAHELHEKQLEVRVVPWEDRFQ